MKEGESTFFYGWWIVLAGFLILFSSIGFGITTFGVFFKPLLKEFGWSRAALSGVMTMTYGLHIILKPLTGKLIDKYRAIYIVVPGILMMSISFSLLSQITTLWHLYILYFIYSLGYALAGTVAATTLVQRWFKEKGGKAMALCWLGSATGSALMAPLAGYMIIVFDWRVSYTVLSLILLTFTLLVGWIVRVDRPEMIGFLPDGVKLGQKTYGEVAAATSFGNPGSSIGARTAALYAKEVPGVSFVEVDCTMKEALITTSFWIIVTAKFFFFVAFKSLLVHLIPFVTDMGISLGLAALAYSTKSTTAIFGKLSYGYLVYKLKLNVRHLLVVIFFLCSLGMVLLAGVTSESLWKLWVAVIIFGAGYGGYFVLDALLIKECFGPQNYGIIYGSAAIASSLALSLGGLISGYFYDLTGSYYLAFMLNALEFIVGGFVIFFARVPKILKNYDKSSILGEKGATSVLAPTYKEG